jgi:tRNA pseudouridine65 synthase
MLLHAWRLRFRHPLDGRPMALEAPLDDAFNGLLARFGWPLPADEISIPTS